MSHLFFVLLTRQCSKPGLCIFILTVPTLCLSLLCLASPRLAHGLKRLWPGLISIHMLLIAAAIVVCLAYLAMPAYFDHVEPAIASISWLSWSGSPVYHDMHTNERYNILYGPYLYIINGVMEGLLGPSIWASKLTGCVSIIAAVAILYWVTQRHVERAVSLMTVGATVALMFYFTNPLPFVARGDSLLLVCAAIGLAAALSDTWASAMILGIALGVSVNVKLHAVGYFGPIAVVAYSTSPRVARAITAIGVASCVALLPFIAWPNVSMTNYIVTLRQAATHGFDIPLSLRVYEFFCLMLVPVVAGVLVSFVSDRAATIRMLRQNTWLILSVCGSALLIAVPASKCGSGPHHWLPFIPSVAWLTVQLYRSGMIVRWSRTPAHVIVSAMLASWMIFMYTTGMVNVYQSIAKCSPASRRTAATMENEVLSLLERYGSNSVLLFGADGDGSGYAKTFYRPLLVFHGMPIGIDPTSLMEFKFARIPTPSMTSLVDEIGDKHGGKQVLWIVPKGAEAFEMRTYYPPDDSLYGQSFRDEFARNYALSGETESYEVYALRNHGTDSSGE